MNTIVDVFRSSQRHYGGLAGLQGGIEEERTTVCQMRIIVIRRLRLIQNGTFYSDMLGERIPYQHRWHKNA